MFLETGVYFLEISWNSKLLRALKKYFNMGLFHAPKQGLTFISVRENQISLKLQHLLYNSMIEIDSHIWMLQESLRESIL